MIFILFFLSAGFVFISHGLDKFSMSKHVSEKHFPTIQFIAKLFLSFALQLTILALVQFLVIETTQFNICAYLFSVKYIHLLLCGYVLIFIYKKYRLMLNEKNLYYIGSIRHSHPNPIQHLNIVLFDATTRLEILEKKLSILKSFSPIPVALLILNNLPQDLIFSPNIKSFVLQNQLNIGLLVILGIYTYHLFSTFSAQKQIITHISKIKKELYLLSSQDSELSISNSRNNPEPP
mgnify:FL=1